MEWAKLMQVAWGEFSMVEAEKRLLANALADPDNQQFVLLSDRWFNYHISITTVVKIVLDFSIWYLSNFFFSLMILFQLCTPA